MKRIATVVALLCVCVTIRGAASEDEDRPELWRVEFEGNAAIETSTLEDAVALTPSSHCWFGSKRYFDSSTLRSDARRIEHLYMRHGYFQTKVARADAVSCSSDKRVCVKFGLVEGAPAIIREFSIAIAGAGQESVDQNDLTAAFGLRPGALFNHDLYLAGKQSIAQLLRKQSHPFPKVEGKVNYDQQANRVDISLTIEPGPKARIGDIKFDGLNQIRDGDARAVVPLFPGEPYTPVKVADASDLLNELQIFDTINTELKPQRDNSAVVDVVFHVREKKLRTLKFGAGVRGDNSRQDVRLHGEWIHKNYHHHLRRFRVLGEPRYAFLPSFFHPQEQGPLGTLELSMLQPGFVSPWQNLESSVAFDANLEQAFRWYGPRFNTNLSRRLSRTLYVGGGYSFRYLTFYHVSLEHPRSTRLVPPQLLSSEAFRLGFIDQTITWDLRDQKTEPRSGVFMQLKTAESAPVLGSSFSYFRVQPEVRGYVPTTSRAVLASRARYGWVVPLAGTGSPITERFYGGGANDHRGFSYHRLSPQVSSSDGHSVPVGGNVGVLFSFEERVQLFTIGERWLQIGLFLDAGDVVEDPKDLDFRRLHYAAGGGFRYDTPVGAIRADVGYRLNRTREGPPGQPNPDPGSRFAIHVSLGEAF